MMVPRLPYMASTTFSHSTLRPPYVSPVTVSLVGSLSDDELVVLVDAGLGEVVVDGDARDEDVLLDVLRRAIRR